VVSLDAVLRVVHFHNVDVQRVGFDTGQSGLRFWGPLKLLDASDFKHLRLKPTLLGTQAQTRWIHIAHTGNWKGHPSGEFDLTGEAFVDVLKNFDLVVDPVVLDYEHHTIDPPPEGAPAAGWVRDLQFKDGKLYGFVEFTERAWGYVERGEYRYCSGVFVFDDKDRKSGDKLKCVMHSVALTNVPFIDGQEPILPFSRRRKAMQVECKGTLDEVRKLLGLPKETDLGGVTEALEHESKLESIRKGKPKAATDVPDDVVEASGIPVEPVEAAQEVALPEESPAEEEEAELSQADEGWALLKDATGLDDAALLEAVRNNPEAFAQAAVQGAEGEGSTAEQTGLKAQVAAARLEAATKKVEDRDAKIAALTKKVADLESTDLERKVDLLVEKGEILEGHRALFAKAMRSGDQELIDLCHKAVGKSVPTEPVAATKVVRETVVIEDEHDEEYKRVKVMLSGNPFLARNPKKLEEATKKFFAEREAS
jgi:hypothetical protein